MPAFLGVAAALVVGALYVSGSSAPAVGGTSAAPADLRHPRPALSAADAPVVLREYADFQCPSCGAFFRAIEPAIRAEYFDTGKVRLEWHDFAWIGQESRDAANAARCAGDQDHFWAYHDLLYQGQGGENSGAFSRDRLEGFGARLGLDQATFQACVDGGWHAPAVQDDLSEVIAKGFNGTPTFVVGGQRIVGAQPIEVFRAAIDAALAKG